MGAILEKIPREGKWKGISSVVEQNFDKLNAVVTRVENATSSHKGYFTTETALKQMYPQGRFNWIAYVGERYPFRLWRWGLDGWYDTGDTGGDATVTIGDVYTAEEVNTLLANNMKEVDRKIQESMGDTVYYKRYDTMEEAMKIVSPVVGSKILIGTYLPAPVYSYNGQEWVPTGENSGAAEINLSDYATDSELAAELQHRDTQIQALQEGLTEIQKGNQKFSLDVQAPAFFEDGKTQLVYLTARITGGVGLIKIMRGDVTIKSSEGLVSSLEFEDSILHSADYTAEARIDSKVMKDTSKVIAVYPCYAGGGTVYTDAIGPSFKQELRMTAEGSYTIDIIQERHKAFLVIPADMEVNRIMMSGLDFPMLAPSNKVVDGVPYKVYESSNPMKKGKIILTVN